MDKKLYRSVKDKKLFGVCGGIAEYFGVDSTVIRLVWVLCVLFAGAGLLAYLLAALVMPNHPVEEDKQINPPIEPDSENKEQ